MKNIIKIFCIAISLILFNCKDDKPIVEELDEVETPNNGNGNEEPGDNQSKITLVNGDALTQILRANQITAESVIFVTTAPWSSRITEGADWITFSPTWSSGTGESAVSISAKMNLTGSDRTAVFTIRSGGEEVDITIEQKAGAITEASFREKEYRAYQHPGVQAAQNRTWAYSLRDNPTGIYARADEDLAVFVDDAHGKEISIVIHDIPSSPVPWGFGVMTLYPLSQGLNRIKAEHSGLIYVWYEDPLEEAAPKIKVNFVEGGLVNGYFDSQKHARDDWQGLLDYASGPEFDLVGKFAHLTMPVSAFKSWTPDGLALIDKYDDLVRLQHEFMGLYREEYKYRQYKNRVYFHADYYGSGAYATAYRTAYMLEWMQAILQLPIDGGTWALAHEVGHVNQIRPGLAWTNMGEVTVNIYSMYVQRSWGLSSSLGMSPNESAYQRGFANVLNKGVPHVQANDVFVMLIPFWQLYLYLHEVLGKTHFWQDLNYSYMANHPTETTDNGSYQLTFVRRCCDIAQLNLLDFFEAWGFLLPVSISGFNITQADVNALKTEIEAKGYPKPPRDFTMITCGTVDEFR